MNSQTINFHFKPKNQGETLSKAHVPEWTHAHKHTFSQLNILSCASLPCALRLDHFQQRTGFLLLFTGTVLFQCILHGREGEFSLHVCGPHRPQRRESGPPRTGAIDIYEPLYGCWETNPSALSHLSSHPNSIF